jgi:predicted ABC-class ATPase
MTKLVSKEKDPITPLLHKVRSLYDDCGISSVLVIGGTGEYFAVADNIIVMDSYTVLDATEKAKTIIASSQSATPSHNVPFIPTTRIREISGSSFSPNGKVKTMSRDIVSYGTVELDLRCVEQLVAKSQTVAIANILQQIPNVAKGGMPLKDVLIEIDRRIDEEGLESLTLGQCNGNMSRPRSFETAAAINRLRVGSSIYQVKSTTSTVLQANILLPR